MFSRREFISISALGLAAASFPIPTYASGMTEKDIFEDSDAPILGNPKGDVTIVEYFDYQCPYCKKVHPTLEKLAKEDGKIKLILKDWPVFGGASVFAAQAVLGAAQIGKYEVALHAMMKTKGQLTEDIVEKALTSAGLSMDEIAKAVNKHSKKISSLLDRNYTQAVGFNFVGTPSFVIGRMVYPGVLDEKALKEAVRAARKG